MVFRRILERWRRRGTTSASSPVVDDIQRLTQDVQQGSLESRRRAMRALRDRIRSDAGTRQHFVQNRATYEARMRAEDCSTNEMLFWCWLLFSGCELEPGDGIHAYLAGCSFPMALLVEAAAEMGVEATDLEQHVPAATEPVPEAVEVDAAGQPEATTSGAATSVGAAAGDAPAGSAEPTPAEAGAGSPEPVSPTPQPEQPEPAANPDPVGGGRGGDDEASTPTPAPEPEAPYEPPPVHHDGGGYDDGGDDTRWGGGGGSYDHDDGGGFGDVGSDFD